jgi:hypothetical protein
MGRQSYKLVLCSLAGLGKMAQRTRRKRLLSDREIVDLYKSGLSAMEVAQQAGTNWSKVLELVREAGETVRPKGSPRPTLPEGVTEADVCRRYRAGESGLQIAASLKIGRNFVYRILEQGGVRLRSNPKYTASLTPSGRSRPSS